jgi:hypothetical protein
VQAPAQPCNNRAPQVLRGGDSVVTVEVSKIGGSSTVTTSDEMGLVVVVEKPTNTIDLMIALLKSLREMGVPLMKMIHHACNFE